MTQSKVSYFPEDKIKWTPDWYPVFKKNRLKHDSGYNCFFVGYKNKKSGEVRVKGEYTDHIWALEHNFMRRMSGIPKFRDKMIKSYDIDSLSLDVEEDGFIRFYTMSEECLIWESEHFYNSSVKLAVARKDADFYI